MSEKQSASAIAENSGESDTKGQKASPETAEQRRARIRAETWKGSEKYQTLEHQRGKPWQNHHAMTRGQQARLAEAHRRAAADKKRLPGPPPLPAIGVSHGARAPRPLLPPMPTITSDCHAPEQGRPSVGPAMATTAGMQRGQREQQQQQQTRQPIPPSRQVSLAPAEPQPRGPRPRPSQPASPRRAQEGAGLTGQQRIQLEVDFDTEWTELMAAPYAGPRRR